MPAVFVWLLVFFISIGGAYGQDLSTLSEEDQLNLLRLIATGNEAFDQGDYEGACEHYGEAAELLDFADIHYRLGGCRERIGDYQGAARAYQRYLELDPEIADRRRIEAEIGRLLERAQAQRVARVMVRSEPEGAAVYREGEEFLGHTPVEATLEPGEHRLVLELQGYLPSERVLEAVGGGNQEIMIALNAPSRLRVVSEPAGTRVYFDEVGGEFIGETPVDVTIEEGEHQIVLSRRGFPEQVRIIQVERGKSVDLDVTMMGPEESGKGFRVMGWTSMGMGLAAAGAAGYFAWEAEQAILAANSYSRSNREHSRETLQAMEEEAVQLQWLSGGSAIAAGSFVALGGLFFVLSRREGGKDTEVVFTPTSEGGAYAGLRLRF